MTKIKRTSPDPGESGKIRRGFSMKRAKNSKKKKKNGSVLRNRKLWTGRPSSRDLLTERLYKRAARYSENRSTANTSQPRNGFTILEMMIVMLVIALLLLITLPNIQQKEKIIRAKGCEALLDIVDSQILLYEIDHLKTPGSISDLIGEGYLDEGQNKCPDGSEVYIAGGQAAH